MPAPLFASFPSMSPTVTTSRKRVLDDSLPVEWTKRTKPRSSAGASLSPVIDAGCLRVVDQSEIVARLTTSDEHDVSHGM
jgi:hypothetical protein